MQNIELHNNHFLYGGALRPPTSWEIGLSSETPFNSKPCLTYCSLDLYSRIRLCHQHFASIVELNPEINKLVKQGWCDNKISCGWVGPSFEKLWSAEHWMVLKLLGPLFQLGGPASVDLVLCIFLVQFGMDIWFGRF